MGEDPAGYDWEFDIEFPLPDLELMGIVGSKTAAAEIRAERDKSLRGRAEKKARLAREQAERERAEREQAERAERERPAS